MSFMSQICHFLQFATPTPERSPDLQSCRPGPWRLSPPSGLGVEGWVRVRGQMQPVSLLQDKGYPNSLGLMDPGGAPGLRRWPQSIGSQGRGLQLGTLQSGVREPRAACGEL